MCTTYIYIYIYIYIKVVYEDKLPTMAINLLTSVRLD